MVDRNEASANEDVDWGLFDPEEYVRLNYETPLEPDLWLLDKLASDWAKMASSIELSRIVDVGAGPNLYPLMVAISYADVVDAVDVSSGNREYLAGQLLEMSNPWRAWSKLLEQTTGTAIETGLLRRGLRIGATSIYELPMGQYDGAISFFCAESITHEMDQFEHGCLRLAESVKSGGLITAAYMLRSEGYSVAGEKFPAVDITLSDIERAFSETTEISELLEVPGGGTVREGYESMGYLTGIRR